MYSAVLLTLLTSAPTQQELVAALPPDDQDLAKQLETLQVVRLELDGQPPAEAVLAGTNTSREDDKTPMSQLWVFRQEGTDWRTVATQEWSVDRYWDGFFDGEPGFKVIRGVELLAPGRSLMRVEHQDLRGGVDVRFISRSFELWRLEGDTLEPVFRCTIDYESAQGPERKSAGAYHRTIDFVGNGWPRKLRVRQKRKEAIYHFDGTHYRTDQKDLC